MSKKHPIVAITGSSGAGTSTVLHSFRHIFRREKIKVQIIHGDSFHRFTRDEMNQAMRASEKRGNKNFSHFGPAANLLDELESLFQSYAKTGTGKFRRYLHNSDEAAFYKQAEGTFTPWEEIMDDTDLLFYEGLHGGVVDGEIHVAQHVDLLIGMVPIVNLEWIQKIVRDTRDRGHSREAVMESIVRSMDDYLNYLTPQFSRTHINFQRVPTVDTSNPVSAKGIPSLDESFVVIRFRGLNNVDFPYLLSMIQGSFMSRHNTLVVPGGKMSFAMELIMRPLIEKLINTGKIS